MCPDFHFLLRRLCGRFRWLFTILLTILRAFSEKMDDLYMDFFSLEDFDDLWELGDFSTEPEAADCESNPTGQKRRWVETVHHMRPHRPRILKADFRRTFPQMWASVFNSADYATMMDHLNHFYDKDVTIMQQDLRLGKIMIGWWSPQCLST